MSWVHGTTGQKHVHMMTSCALALEDVYAIDSKVADSCKTSVISYPVAHRILLVSWVVQLDKECMMSSCTLALEDV